jgi:hypothetical protein
MFRLGSFPLVGQWFQRVIHFGPYEGDRELNRQMVPPESWHQEPNVVTSVVWQDVYGLRYRVDKPKEVMHKPVLDIDVPVEIQPSSTPGHFHLAIDKEMTWQQYERLLDILVEVGIVEPGFAAASISRGYSAVRLPWVKKEDAGREAENLQELLEDDAKHETFQQ